MVAQVENVELPRPLIDEQPRIEHFGAVPFVRLGSHQVAELDGAASHFRKRQAQATLPLTGGVVDCHNATLSGSASPGVRNKIVVRPVARPSRQGINLRPRAVAKSLGLLQHIEQAGIERFDLWVGRLDWTTA